MNIVHNYYFYFEYNLDLGLHLGDELVSVNEANLQGVTHLEAVQKLRNSKGPVVILKVKPNRILEGPGLFIKLN